ncbi:VacJ family lipoprotein [Acinetobacter guerrae]|uniref:VacJ family lipoprotein n=1 Tax=Acinetobacter guerrae TaxID=1843371 RepID=A0A3A8EJX5_9GAMM|nr:VacJ family lipoprotein [Acinetobacter guerrae]MPW43557.1 VacJ family lipoprotein [Acinetobacter guerrae]RKG33796.1 VacJ family lipoprotein [Acinetobacter guerrae]
MHYSKLVFIGLLSTSLSFHLFAQESTKDVATDAVEDVPSISESDTPEHRARFQKLKDLKDDLKNVKASDFKVNANAAQPDDVKDPLQPLNRQFYAFNDALDRTIVRPIAVQYTQKTPEQVRGSYRLFRKNLGEPWNAVNQLIQGRPSRAAKTLGRFTINTLTTFGLADPARRLGLPAEEESFGVTLGYYGVPSGPFLMLPFFGPSTLRDGFGLVVDSQTRPQKYIMDDQDGLYWSTNMLQAIDTRAQVLDIEQILQGDKYAVIRDLYLQRKNFQIAEKKGNSSEQIQFIDDDSDDGSDDASHQN